MALSIYNTLTRKREPFIPQDPNKVGMYACGVTTYDICHIGHAMQAIIYDVIRNYLEFLGYEVTYVRNYTDVDDKIIDRAKQLGISPLEHSRHMIEETERDLSILGVAPGDVQPKVSEHIPEIIALIEELIQRGHAYAAEGDVYFQVNSFPEYGALSNRTPEDMRAGARVAVNPKKKDPLDFALWKRCEESDASWPSPWGEGRPGWHIECSALAMKYLGRNFDIHGGGKDLIFPHHENEIAQSRGACPCHFAKYWIHNGLVTVEGRKMSKSFQNFISIRDAVERYYPETIRFTILRHHYGSNIDFNEKGFYDAYSRLLYFYNTLKHLEDLEKQVADFPANDPPNLTVPDVLSAFRQAMDDDFNTAAAIREIGAGFKFLNDLIAAKKPKLKQKMHTLLRVRGELQECLKVLGILQAPPEQALAEIQGFLIKEKGIDVAAIESAIEARNLARAEKDWSKADAIRDDLVAQGISVMDTAEGTAWQVQP